MASPSRLKGSVGSVDYSALSLADCHVLTVLDTAQLENLGNVRQMPSSVAQVRFSVWTV